MFIIQRCQGCNTPFSWKKIHKSFLWGWGYSPIYCDYCGAKHQKTILGNFTFFSLTFVPMVIFMNLLSPFNNAFSTIGVGIVIFFIGSFFAPYFVRLDRRWPKNETNKSCRSWQLLLLSNRAKYFREQALC